MDINSPKVPDHIAIIMDGNNRWAKKRLLPTSAGHKAGSESTKSIIKEALNLKIKYLTLYAFSTENWQRPDSEVKYLMNLLKNYLNQDIKELMDSDIRVVISGDLLRVDSELKQKIKEIEDLTKHNKAITLNIAFDYGSRQEIVSAVRKIAQDVKNQIIKIEEIDPNLISNNLYRSDIPDPDLLIRTSGELRLSNFLLWQLAYTELYFTKKLWPDFSPHDLKDAIFDFNQRKRSYGKRVLGL